MNSDIQCCGLHEACERKMLAAPKEAEYYDDEELDAYRGRSADSYTEAEVEEFRYVLYTMREDEVAGWLRSLELRRVELPQELRDEVIMIVGDLRQ
ncbi:MAG: phospholipase [Prevotellaceae bacterium]|nr:phospholipase [Prevotellaceae bacterium]